MILVVKDSVLACQPTAHSIRYNRGAGREFAQVTHQKVVYSVGKATLLKNHQEDPSVCTPYS